MTLLNCLPSCLKLETYAGQVLFSMEAATEVTLARLKQRACFCTVHAYMRAKHEVLTWGILFIVCVAALVCIVCVAALVCLINGC